MQALPAPPKFLQLPDELLLNIALSFDNLDTNQHLVQLALSCRRFRSVAREALLRTAAVTPAALHGFVKFLLEYPENIPKVRTLQLYATHSHAWPCFHPSPGYFSSGPHDLDPTHADLVKKIHDEQPQIARVQVLLSHGGCTQTAMILALVILLSNLKELSLSGPFFRKFSALDCPIRHWVRKEDHKPCRQSCILKTLGSKITKLDFNDVPHETRRHCYQFGYFSSLKELSIMAKSVIYNTALLPRLAFPPSNYSQPGKVLPSSLVTLNMFLEDIEYRTTPVLNWIEKVLDPSQNLPFLRHFRPYFKMTFDEYEAKMCSYNGLLFMIIIEKAVSRRREPPFPTQKKLATLEEAGLRFQTFFWKTLHSRDRGQTAADDKKRVQELDSSLFQEVPPCKVFISQDEVEEE